MSSAFVMIDSEGKAVSVTVVKGDLVFTTEESPFRITMGQLDGLIDWLEDF